MSTNKTEVLQLLQQTPAIQIADLPFVQEKFIANYNACHKDKNGELMYFRNVVHFKQQISTTPALQQCDQLSLYACFVTAAVNGYSLDPQDSEVYILPLKGKAYLWRQAGAHVRRLIRTNQIQYVDQAKLVYEGDVLEVVNGRVLKHIETFKTETIIAGYVRMVIDEQGNDRFFIYRKSDFESWKKKSQQSNGENWSGGLDGQPNTSFLRTKIVKHAATEKCWAVGITPASIEVLDGVEIDTDEVPTDIPLTPSEVVENTTAEIINDEKAFATEPAIQGATVSHDDDNF
jgi:recombinational DNA repair protein RecT